MGIPFRPENCRALRNPGAGCVPAPHRASTADGAYPLHKPTFFQAGQASGKSRGWIQGDSDACGAGCSSGGGTVMGPISSTLR